MNSLNKVQSHLLAECFNKLFIGGQFVDAIDGKKIQPTTLLQVIFCTSSQGAKPTM